MEVGGCRKGVTVFVNFQIVVSVKLLCGFEGSGFELADGPKNGFRVIHYKYY